MTSVRTHFKSASTCSKADTFVKLQDVTVTLDNKLITETINTLFPVVSFFKCVV